MNTSGENITLRHVIVTIILFLLLLLGTMVVFNKYSLFFIPLILLVSISLFKYGLELKYYYLLYLSVIPLIQHFGLPVLQVGDFYITPHMVIQFSLFLLCLINYFYSYDYSKNIRLGTIDILMISFGVVSLLSIIFGYSLPENNNWPTDGHPSALADKKIAEKL